MSGPVALGVEIGCKVIGKEKQLENGKNDEHALALVRSGALRRGDG